MMVWKLGQTGDLHRAFVKRWTQALSSRRGGNSSMEKKSFLLYQGEGERSPTLDLTALLWSCLHRDKLV